MLLGHFFLQVQIFHIFELKWGTSFVREDIGCFLVGEFNENGIFALNRAPLVQVARLRRYVIELKFNIDELALHHFLLLGKTLEILVFLESLFYSVYFSENFEERLVETVLFLASYLSDLVL